MRKTVIVAACLATAIGASPAVAGALDDIVSVINDEPLPTDRLTIARSSLAETACKSSNPWRGDLQRRTDQTIDCFKLTPAQIEHYVQERRQEATEVRRHNNIDSDGFHSHESVVQPSVDVIKANAATATKAQLAAADTILNEIVHMPCPEADTARPNMPTGPDRKYWCQGWDGFAKMFGLAVDPGTAAAGADDDYKQMSIADFLLDGKTLAAGSQKISLAGTYVHGENSDWLYPANTPPRLMEKNNGVLLISDDATREFRRLLMSTWSKQSMQFFGAPGFAIRGRAAMCTYTTLVGTEQLPCLAIEDGDNQAGVEVARKANASADEFVRKNEAERKAEEDRQAAAFAALSARMEASRVAREKAATAENAAMHAAAMHDSGPWCRLHPEQCRR